MQTNQPPTGQKTLSVLLDEIEARANGATLAPWVYNHEKIEARSAADELIADCDCPVWFHRPERQRNAKFIAAARSDVPALILAHREARTRYFDSVGGQPDLMAVYDDAISAIIAR